MAEEKQTQPADNSSNAQGAKGEVSAEAEEKKEETPAQTGLASDQPKGPEKGKKKIEAAALSADARKVVEMVGKMTVLELSELVKVLEEKFGVSAAAPVAALPTGGGQQAVGGAAAAEEKSIYTVNLVDAGANKVAVIRAIREVIQLGLKETKDLVDGAPKTVKENVKREEAEAMKKKLEEAGARVELV